MKKFAVMTAVLLAAVWAGQASAAGFRLPDQDAAAIGMGGAFVAQADDPSAAWYNPAAMTTLEGTQMSVGIMTLAPVMEHQNVNGTTDTAERQMFLLGDLFFTTKVDDRVSAGLSLTGPFGLSTNWSALSATSRVAAFSRIISVDINPNVAYRLNDRLSLALGLDFMKLEATMEKMLSPVTLFRLDGQGTGWGANAAILYKAEPVDLGLSYRSRIKVDVEDAHANVVGFPAAFTNSVKTEITLPDLIEGGISWKLSDRTTLNSDLEYTWWSTYDRLVLESNTFVALGLGPVQTDEKQWRNTWTFRLGGQYKVSDQWKLRAGYVYDQTPVQEAHFETRAPDADRQGITVGTGFTARGTTVDVSYMYIRFKTRHINDSLADGASQVLNGTYDSHAQLLAVNVAHKF